MATAVVLGADQAATERLAHGLAERGWQAVMTTDGNAAVEAVHQHGARLLLASTEASRQNGYSVCNRLKRGGSAPTVVLVHSAAASAVAAQHAKLSTRADHYLQDDAVESELRQLPALAPPPPHSEAPPEPQWYRAPDGDPATRGGGPSRATVVAVALALAVAIILLLFGFS